MKNVAASRPVALYLVLVFVGFWGCLALGYVGRLRFWVPILGALAPDSRTGMWPHSRGWPHNSTMNPTSASANSLQGSSGYRGVGPYLMWEMADLRTARYGVALGV